MFFLIWMLYDIALTVLMFTCCKYFPSVGRIFNSEILNAGATYKMFKHWPKLSNK